MPRFPDTAQSAQGLSPKVFSRLAAKAQDRPDRIYPLHVGDTWMEPLEAARAESQRTAEHPRLHNYAPVHGEPALLEAIEAHLERRGDCLVDRDNLQVTSGATAGLSVVAEALFDPGDEVLLPAPYWPLIRGIIAKRGATPVEVPFFDRVWDEGFEAEAALEAAVTERTVAVYVNTPHNPTGTVLPDDVVAAIGRVAERHDLWIVSDEVYEDLYFGGLPPEPVWARADYQRRCVAAHSVSKAYGLAGARVGWVHGPHEAMATIRGVQTFSTYCAPRPMQLGAARALNEGEAWLADARRSYRDAAARTASALGLREPQGGTFVFFDVSHRIGDDETVIDVLERCLDAGVLLTPGAASGRDYARWVRLCFTSVPPDALSEALDRIAPLVGC
ncbi:MAG TPA: pyridoxal phosphate-dependent aminotransferase [Sandaracinaceae bacterium LLY-WYZ-13_1]|nr:pyridoxal phosphate-dependent aminotransferase [Sandaracinaceae bacterium LLY-WYZ-13_1]